MTNGRSGLSLSKGSLLPPCSWLPCLCFLSPWLQTPTRFLHLLCFHMFDISLDLSPGILGLCLLLNPQKLQSPQPSLSPTHGQACLCPHIIKVCVGWVSKMLGVNLSLLDDSLILEKENMKFFGQVTLFTAQLKATA